MLRGFIVNQNHALDAWFGKNYVVDNDKKLLCCIMKVRSAKCTRNEKRVEIGKILRQLCEWKSVKIVNAEVCPDPYTHVGRDTTENISIEFYGISQGKKQYDAV